MKTSIKGCLAGLAAFVALASSWAFEVRPFFRAERFSRGDTNLRVLQPIDTADWIWIDDRGPDDGEMDAVRFVCAFEAMDSSLEIDVSADERFVLFLDGREIARGPHKGLVSHWYYQTYRIDSLARGTHQLEAVVYRMGDAGPRAVLSAGKGAFILKAGSQYDPLVTTGNGAWRARRIVGTRIGGFGDSETFGGSAQCTQVGTGFLDPAAATGPLCATKTVRRRVEDNAYGHPRSDWALFPTERPDQAMVRRTAGRFVAGQARAKISDDVCYAASDATFPLVADMNALLYEGRPVDIPARTSVVLIWDLGDYFSAYPLLETSGGAGAEIRWGWAESLYDGRQLRADRSAFDGKCCAHALRDTFRMDGRKKAMFATPWWRCGRWCEFEVKTADEPVTIRRLAFDEVRYPLEEKAYFECDDPSIAAVWRLCLRGLENCMHETYMDCPFFEQQMYPGDTRVAMCIAAAVSGDGRLSRFASGLFDYARREDGLVPMICPSRAVQDSATYSMCWVAMLADYALWHGGKDFLKARLPGMRHTLSCILGCANADGLLDNLPGWSFQDWVDEWDSFGNAPDGKRGASAINNLLAAHALDCAARVEEFAGDRRMADWWRTKKEELANAITAAFWCESRGLVADTTAKDRFSEHAQCLALLTDILPPDRANRALKGLLEDGDLAHASVYFSHYLFSVLAKNGRTDVLFKRLDLWRDYVKTGLKTPLESPGERARSDCHAWGSHPIYHLLTGVAGLRPAADGFASVTIAPCPGGCKWIRAGLPTPKGLVSVDLRFDDGGVRGTVTVPEGMPAVFRWNGVDRPLASGTQGIAIHQP